MTTFFIGIAILIVGYFTYGAYINRVFVPNDDQQTPAYTKQDGVDFMPLGEKKNSLIQLLNIAGTGPIFGAIQGALFGPIAFLLIPIGNIFAGAVHDYFIGLLSVRNNGEGLPKLAQKFLGRPIYHLVNALTAILLLLVGAVFVKSPADLFAATFGGVASTIAIIIFVYYIVATLLPIDKIIGRFYPLFGALLLLSAAAIFIGIVLKGYSVPNFTLASINEHPSGLPIFPLFFTTVTCGLISGFHATQSPLVSRTLQKESQGRRVFYGMMVVEGIIAMIWALGAMVIFREGGAVDLVAYVGNPAGVVMDIATLILGAGFGTIAVLGIIVLPITSGDTAFRSLRLIIAEYINLPQGGIKNRLVIALPIFLVGFALVFFIDFSLLWRYFAWANQTVGTVALFVCTAYLYKAKKPYFITLVPAVFLAYVSFAYILNAKIGFNMSWNSSYVIGGILTAITTAFFLFSMNKQEKEMRSKLAA
ncbi:MAG: carbon starvation protein A [Bacillaceae bacterium]